MPVISPWTANHLSEKPSLFEFDDGQGLHTPAAFSYKSSVCGALHCSDAGSAIPLVAVSKKDWTLRVRSVVSAIWCICKKGESSGTTKVGGRGRRRRTRRAKTSQSVVALRRAPLRYLASRRLRTRPVQNVQNGADPRRAHPCPSGYAPRLRGPGYQGVRDWYRIATSGFVGLPILVTLQTEPLGLAGPAGSAPTASAGPPWVARGGTPAAGGIIMYQVMPRVPSIGGDRLMRDSGNPGQAPNATALRGTLLTTHTYTVGQGALGRLGTTLQSAGG